MERPQSRSRLLCHAVVGSPACRDRWRDALNSVRIYVERKYSVRGHGKPVTLWDATVLIVWKHNVSGHGKPVTLQLQFYQRG